MAENRVVGLWLGEEKEFFSEASSALDTDRAKAETAAPQTAAAASAPLSEFSPEECLRFVHLCREDGEEVRNPQGLAIYLHRTGNSDASIRARLYPESRPDIEQELYGAPRKFSRDPCTVCYGAKLEIVEGKGACRCTHCKDERGKATGFEPEDI